VSPRLTACFLMVLPSAVYAQYYGEGYHSSTLEEGIQRGHADVVRSYGMANLLNSQAAQGFQQAQKDYLDNRKKATETYFEMRRYHDEAVKAQRSPPLSMDQYVRLAREHAPERLTTTQLDPLTGAVNWPAALRIPEYAPFRAHIERLLHDRAAGYAVYGEIPNACQQFSQQLQADIMKFQPQDYLNGKKFLESLTHSARGVQG
jgi:hypothetical protein